MQESTNDRTPIQGETQITPSDHTAAGCGLDLAGLDPDKPLLSQLRDQIAGRQLRRQPAARAVVPARRATTAIKTYRPDRDWSPWRHCIPTAALAFYDPWTDLNARYPEWSVVSEDLANGLLGLADHPRRQIVLASWMLPAEVRSTLAHEIVHLDLCHARCQDAATELVVDELALLRLVAPARFEAAWIEQEHRPDRLAEALGIDLQHVRLLH